MATRQSTAVIAGIMPDYTLPGLVLCRTAIFTNKIVGSGETIEMIPVPKGAKIIDMNVAVAALAGSCSDVEVGDGGSNARFFNGISLTDADGAYSLAGNGVPGAIGYEYPADDTVDIYVTKAVAGPQTTTNWILNVFYKMAGSLADEDNLSNY